MIADYPQWLQDVSAHWGEAKFFVENTLGISNDLAHVIAGPLVQLLAALILRRSVQRVAPWLVVLVLELFNEWHDLVIETWPVRTMQYGEGLKDILLTMMLPTVVLLLTRNYPHWFGMKPLRSKRRERSGLY
jgi:hypothetical protein